jgi:hypothetical protein
MRMNAKPQRIFTCSLSVTSVLQRGKKSTMNRYAAGAGIETTAQLSGWTLVAYLHTVTRAKERKEITLQIAVRMQTGLAYEKPAMPIWGSIAIDSQIMRLLAVL